ncbi:unnamed protein product [Anisakis simplex]|uniref:P-type domain-containing protein n=1 Tax=Anisakis simplex TaxID=6269 RepID=A0A0M3J1T9_ANISI|nr:unnamed protein product [Anisakis simplex]
MSNVPNIAVIEIFGYEAVPMLSTIRKQSKDLIVNLDESYFDERMKQMLIIANSFYNFDSDTAVTITWKNHPLADLMPKQSRIECMPQTQPLPDMTSCEAKNCIFDRDAGEGIPTCYYPRISGYKIKQKDHSAMILEKYGTIETPYGKSLKEISFSTSYLKESTLNVRIGAPGRFEPPLHFPKESFFTNETFTVKTSNETGIFSFKVIRVSNNRTIWDTSIGGMMFADQFIQIGAFIGSSQIYGIGENQQWRLRHNIMQYTTWPMMARDQPPDSERSRSLIKKNLYGVYPFYLAVENDYKAHGVLIVNSNPQEITLGPAPHFVYRTIGGMLDIYFFPGPSPQDVIRQYLALVGHPTVPAYWALGFQISRYGYKSLSEVKAVVNDMRKAGIPLDVVYADIDYMDRYQDFTIGKVTLLKLDAKSVN